MKSVENSPPPGYSPLQELARIVELAGGSHQPSFSTELSRIVNSGNATYLSTGVCVDGTRALLGIGMCASWRKHTAIIAAHLKEWHDMSPHDRKQTTLREFANKRNLSWRYLQNLAHKNGTLTAQGNKKLEKQRKFHEVSADVCMRGSRREVVGGGKMQQENSGIPADLDFGPLAVYPDAPESTKSQEDNALLISTAESQSLFP